MFPLSFLIAFRFVHMFWSDNPVLTLCLLLLPCLDDRTEPAVPTESACGSRPVSNVCGPEILENIS